MVPYWRLVYDVRNDGPPWLGGLMVLLLLVVASGFFEELLLRLHGGRSTAKSQRPGGIESLPGVVLVVAGLFFGYLGVRCASYTYRTFADQRLCEKWVRVGRYHVVEGVVKDYQGSKAGPRFKVGGLAFDLLQRAVGFAGRFNVPAGNGETLRDGMRVRLGHRSGTILRVEIEAQEPARRRSGQASRPPATSPWRLVSR